MGASANENVIMVGAVTLSNANVKDAAATIGGALVGGLIGRGIASTASGNMAQNGHGVLTNRRFVFGSSKAFKKLNVGATVNFAESLSNGDVYYDIPLSDIVNFSQGKQGFSTLFALETHGGVYKFALLKKSMFAEWEAGFAKARGR